MSALPFRPHHLLCTLSYSGHGYSPEFTEKMDGLVARLRAGEEPQLMLTCSADTLCAVCPNRRGDGCSTDEKVMRYDRLTLEALGLRDGDVISYGECKRLLRQRIDAARFEHICGDCQWRELCRWEDMLRVLAGSR